MMHRSGCVFVCLSVSHKMMIASAGPPPQSPHLCRQFWLATAARVFLSLLAKKETNKVHREVQRVLQQGANEDAK